MHNEELKNNTKLRHFWVYLSIITWIVYILWAFWFYWIQPIQPFYIRKTYLATQDLVVFYQKDLSQQLKSQNFLSKISLSPEKKGYILYFVDENCQCNRYIRDFEEKLQAFSHNFVKININKKDSTISIPASPAFAIVDRNGIVKYFGPYALPEFCGATNTKGHWDLIQNKLLHIDSFNSEQTPEIDMLVNGCFCAWEKHT